MHFEVAAVGATVGGEERGKEEVMEAEEAADESADAEELGEAQAADAAADLDCEQSVSRALAQPTSPSAEEWRGHQVAHLPYRSWCPHCIRGRARQDGHPQSAQKADVPFIGLDFGYLTSSDIDNKDLLPILMVREKMSQALLTQ